MGSKDKGKGRRKVSQLAPQCHICKKTGRLAKDCGRPPAPEDSAKGSQTRGPKDMVRAARRQETTTSRKGSAGGVEKLHITERNARNRFDLPGPKGSQGTHFEVFRQLLTFAEKTRSAKTTS